MRSSAVTIASDLSSPPIARSFTALKLAQRCRVIAAALQRRAHPRQRGAHLVRDVLADAGQRAHQPLDFVEHPVDDGASRSSGSRESPAAAALAGRRTRCGWPARIASIRRCARRLSQRRPPMRGGGRHRPRGQGPADDGGGLPSSWTLRPITRISPVGAGVDGAHVCAHGRGRGEPASPRSAGAPSTEGAAAVPRHCRRSVLPSGVEQAGQLDAPGIVLQPVVDQSSRSGPAVAGDEVALADDRAVDVGVRTCRFASRRSRTAPRADDKDAGETAPSGRSSSGRNQAGARSMKPAPRRLWIIGGSPGASTLRRSRPICTSTRLVCGTNR